MGQAQISRRSTTHLSITDPGVPVVSSAPSSARSGFKGSRKLDPVRCAVGAESARGRRGVRHEEVDVFVKGPGSGLRGPDRSAQAAGLEVGLHQRDVPAGANGCRPPSAPRLAALTHVGVADARQGALTGPHCAIRSPCTPISRLTPYLRRARLARHKCHYGGHFARRGYIVAYRTASTSPGERLRLPLAVHDQSRSSPGLGTRSVTPCVARCSRRIPGAPQ